MLFAVCQLDERISPEPAIPDSGAETSFAYPAFYGRFRGLIPGLIASHARVGQVVVAFEGTFPGTALGGTPTSAIDHAHPERLARDRAHCIAQRYAEIGASVFAELLGEFALIVFDLEERRLFVGTDYLGLHAPFFRITQEGRILVSTRIAPLVDGSTPVNPTYVALAASTVFQGSVPVRVTARRNIERVLPGSYVVFERQRLRRVRYWSPQRLGPLVSTSPGEASEELRPLLRAAVRADLPSSGATVAFSGGLDSTALLYLYADCRGPLEPTVSTITLATRRPTGDEPFRDLVLDHFSERTWFRSALLHEEDIPPATDFTQLPKTDEPTPAVALDMPTIRAFAQQAAHFGASVLAFGSYGDTIFGRQDHWVGSALLSKAALLGVRGIWECARMPNHNLVRTLASLRGLRRGRRPGPYLELVVPRSMARGIAGMREEMEWLLAEIDACGNYGYRYMFNLMQIENDAWHRTEYITSQFGVRVATPFAFRPLVEFLLRRQHLNQIVHSTGEVLDKVLLRSALAPWWPEAIRCRRTKGNAGDSVSSIRGAWQVWHELFLDGNCRLADLGLLDPSLMKEELKRWYVGVEESAAELIPVEVWLRSL